MSVSGSASYISMSYCMELLKRHTSATPFQHGTAVPSSGGKENFICEP